MPWVGRTSFLRHVGNPSPSKLVCVNALGRANLISTGIGILAFGVALQRVNALSRANLISTTAEAPEPYAVLGCVNALSRANLIST